MMRDNLPHLIGFKLNESDIDIILFLNKMLKLESITSDPEFKRKFGLVNLRKKDIIKENYCLDQIIEMRLAVDRFDNILTKIFFEDQNINISVSELIVRLLHSKSKFFSN